MGGGLVLMVLCPSEAELNPPLHQGVSNIFGEHALGWAFPVYTHQLGMQAPGAGPSFMAQTQGKQTSWSRAALGRRPGLGACVDNPGTSICA